MADQEASEAPNSSAAHMRPNSILRRLRNFKSYLHERRVKTREQNPLDRAAISTARATWAIAVLTVVTIGVTWFQYRIFDRQLTVMQGQLDAMESDQRPWIKPMITVAGLRFTEAGDAEISYFTNFKNVGKSPAQNVKTRFSAAIITEQTIFDSVSEQMIQCNLAGKDTSEKIPGLFVFPDEEAPQLLGGKGIGRAYVSSTEFTNAWPNSKTLSFKVVGCFDYSFSSGRHGQTGFTYIVSKRAPADFSHRSGFEPIKGDVPFDQIAFEPDPFSGGFVK